MNKKKQTIVGTNSLGWSVKIGDTVSRVTDGVSFTMIGRDKGFVSVSRKLRTTRFGSMSVRGEQQTLRLPACAVGIVD